MATTPAAWSHRHGNQSVQRKGWDPVADGWLLNTFDRYGDYVITAVVPPHVAVVTMVTEMQITPFHAIPEGSIQENCLVQTLLNLNAALSPVLT